VEQTVVNNEHAGKEKGERGIFLDVPGSQYWKDNQQNTESYGTRKGILPADDGHWLKMGR